MSLGPYYLAASQNMVAGYERLEVLPNLHWNHIPESFHERIKNAPFFFLATTVYQWFGLFFRGRR